MTPEARQAARETAAHEIEMAAHQIAARRCQSTIGPLPLTLAAAARMYSAQDVERRILAAMFALYSEERPEYRMQLYQEIAEAARHGESMAEDDYMNGDGWTAARESAAEALADR